MTTGISFQGVTSGLQTDQLVAAIIAQEGLPLQRLQDKQTANTQRTTSLNTMQSDMAALSTSLQTLQYTASGFDARTVSSSDANNAYVTATARGAEPGNYDLKVTSAATKGRILPTLDGAGLATNLAATDPAGGGTSQVFTAGSPASFAIQGTDGVVKVVTLDDNHNSLYGLQDAINASGAGVVASVVNTGQGTKPYQLVLTAKDQGTGTTGGVVTLADVTSGGMANNLGITAGTVDNLGAPTTVSGGLQSAAATDAVFSVNGVQLTRKSNVVTDAVDGVTFNIKQGQQTGTTTLTVTEDKATITTAMQDVISKFNALASHYKFDSTATKGSDGSIVQGPLSNDATARNILAQVSSALHGVPADLPASAVFHSTGDLGIKANTDGTLTLDVTAFQKALDKDPDAAKRVFNFTGTTDNGVVTFNQGGAKTISGDVAFQINSYDSSTGNWSGVFTPAGGAAVTVSGTKGGTMTGATGTPLEGLMVNVTGTGSGTLSLVKGVAQRTQDVIASLTAYQGTMWNTVARITEQNKSLTSQIESKQALLDKRQADLKQKFAEMEASLSQLRAAGGSLGGA